MSILPKVGKKRTYLAEGTECANKGLKAREIMMSREEMYFRTGAQYEILEHFMEYEGWRTKGWAWAK